MNDLLKRMLAGGGYMAENDGGEGGGGGGAVDRGDFIVPPTGGDDAGNGEGAGDGSADGAGEGAGEGDDAGEGAGEGEGDGDGAGEGDGTGEDDGAPAAKTGKKDPVIPKARFDEARAKARAREAALEARIKELETTTKAEAAVIDAKKLDDEVAELEDQYQKALDDGKMEIAKELMRNIRLKERQIILAEASTKSEAARAQAIEQFKFDSIVEKLETAFPMLNPDDDSYDEGKVNEVVFLRQSFERSGMSSSDAITKAVKYVLGDPPSNEDSGAPAGKKPSINDGKPAGGNRRAEQLAKNIAVAGKQPPKTAATGVDSHRKGAGAGIADVNDMSDEEFNALPAATKARLRGDTIAEEIAA